MKKRHFVNGFDVKREPEKKVFFCVSVCLAKGKSGSAVTE